MTPLFTYIHDRIYGIKITIPSSVSSLYIIYVYLPQQKCTLGSFEDVTVELEFWAENLQLSGQVVIIGD